MILFGEGGEAKVFVKRSRFIVDGEYFDSECPDVFARLPRESQSVHQQDFPQTVPSHRLAPIKRTDFRSECI